MLDETIEAERGWRRTVFTGRTGECVADMGGIRSFLTRAYPTMKKNNPHTPIMLREAAGTQPRVYARYGQSMIPGGEAFKGMVAG